jgi:hypothetical protein
MVPFAGIWRLDLEKTLAAQKEAGATDEQISLLRQLYAQNTALGKMHPDLTFTGNEAVGSGGPSAEYRFFSMHQHGSKTCGKAWHHEDRFDPGDMSKCRVRLEIIDGNLHLQVNMDEGLPDLNDPDLVSEPPVEGNLAQCDAETLSENQPRVWFTYVFSR